MQSEAATILNQYELIGQHVKRYHKDAGELERLENWKLELKKGELNFLRLHEPNRGYTLSVTSKDLDEMLTQLIESKKQQLEHSAVPLKNFNFTGVLNDRQA